LFFTAQSKPSSFEILRSYVLHHLFGKSGHNTSSGAFTFPHRALTVERDVLLVPAGWDSFGKIRALRDGFDCAGMANGWEWDAQVEKVRRNRGLPKGSREAEDLAEQQVDRRMLPGLVDGDRDGVESAIKLFEDIIEDWDASAPVSGKMKKNVLFSVIRSHLTRD
jgi:dynein light intermediate chain 1